MGCYFLDIDADFHTIQKAQFHRSSVAKGIHTRFWNIVDIDKKTFSSVLVLRLVQLLMKRASVKIKIDINLDSVASIKERMEY